MLSFRLAHKESTATLVWLILALGRLNSTGTLNKISRWHAMFALQRHCGLLQGNPLSASVGQQKGREMITFCVAATPNPRVVFHDVDHPLFCHPMVFIPDLIPMKFRFQTHAVLMFAVQVAFFTKFCLLP